MRSFYEGAKPLLVRLIYLQNQRRVERKLLTAGRYFSFVGAAAPIVVERSSILTNIQVYGSLLA